MTLGAMFSVPPAATVNPFQYVGLNSAIIGTPKPTVTTCAQESINPRLQGGGRVDPLRFADGLNMYLYVENNPADSIDPSGRVIISYTPRGRFKSAQISEFASRHHQWFPNRGSDFSVNWEAMPNEFLAKNLCRCLCTSVGLVQIYSSNGQILGESRKSFKI